MTRLSAFRLLLATTLAWAGVGCAATEPTVPLAPSASADGASAPTEDASSPSATPSDPASDAGDEPADEPADEPTDAVTGEGAPVVLTEDDHGRTVEVSVGGRVTVRLGRDWVWDEPVTQGATADVTRVDHESDPGYTEWTVTPRAAGQIVVRVHGEPQPNGDERARDVEFELIVG